MSGNSKSMIERVALAIERTMFIAEELPCDPELHEKYKGTARAAIEAMREPTEAMMEAAWAVNSGDCKDDYQAAIDAALGEYHP